MTIPLRMMPFDFLKDQTHLQQLLQAIAGDVLAAADNYQRQGAFRVYPSQENHRDIHFEKIDLNGRKIPEEQLDLKDEVEKVLFVLDKLFPQSDKQDTFDIYFPQLLSIAQLGLVGPEANPTLASRTLKVFNDNLVAREGARVKNKYMRKLAARSLLFGVPSLTLAFILKYAMTEYIIYSCILFIWSGCMGGVWLSFGIRKVSISLDDLYMLEADGLEPIVRLFFAGLLGIIASLVFATKSVVVSVGELSTADIFLSSKVALLIGFLCGISEIALSEKISKIAPKIVDLKVD